LVSAILDPGAAIGRSREEERVMGPTFTTEIGRMRTQEAIARAEHYRLTQMARKSNDPAPRPEKRRRSFFSWRRLVGVATTAVALSVVFATTALGMPTGGGGGVAEHIAPTTPSPTSVSTDFTILFLGGTAVVVALAAGAWIAWFERRTPKLA